VAWQFHVSVFASDLRERGISVVVALNDCFVPFVSLWILAMNYPAASRWASSSVLARHSVRDTPAPYLIRGNPVGPSGYRLPPVWRTRGKPRGIDPQRKWRGGTFDTTTIPMLI